ncbi:response regulator [Gilvimarinus chinensis]|uniref:response regulator n=1 Tax=Gilvimarinus chinensis TaxID=396005 RepID=UPI000372C2AF|nr:response regulator [Gilvimarinus chinensis]
MQGVKLLIVDDDEDDFMLAKDLLDEITVGPYELDWAGSYDAGKEVLAENRHDLCLMDYKLGAHDGIELLREAQTLGYTGPIILLTGMHQGEVDMQALQAGAVDYLVKDSLSAEQLARSIRYALARREMEHERVERLKAEAENRSKSEFLAHLSHELRTPLSAILGFTELLINTNKDEDSLSHLRVVQRNGKHLLGLLNDILDLSKIEAGKLELEIQPVYLSSFLTDIYFLMHGAAVDKSLQLQLEAPSPLPYQIHTDPTRLRQVLLNLLGNAIKFTDFGSVSLKVIPHLHDGREQLKFLVQDSGIGIRKEALLDIFQPFVQTREASYSEPRAGTGLGLAISQQLVERLGGEISVDSTPGEGSCFEFTIDMGDVTDIERRVFSIEFDSQRTSESDIPQLTGKVLVVDDLRDIRMLIGHFVKQAGLQVVYARNGEEALKVAALEEEKGEPFDIILMDIHMPVMGGHEAAQKFREAGAKQPLIALTAAHMKGDMDKCLESGFSAYLSKPVDQQQLYSALATYLNVQQKAEVESGHRTIMVVEDDADALQATSSLLELLGWEVLQASDAQQALVHLDSGSPQTILMDLNLPDASGYDLAGQCKSLAPEAKIIVLSGEPVDQARVAAAGISASFMKPVSLSDLQTL